MLKRIADPRDGRAIANASSRTGWSVSGCGIGYSRSIAESATDKRMLQYAVFAANFFPRIINPRIKSIILAIKVKSLADRDVDFAINTARPVIPPKVKLLENLKK